MYGEGNAGRQKDPRPRVRVLQYSCHTVRFHRSPTWPIHAREITINPDLASQDVAARWRRSGKVILAVAAIASIFQAALIAQRMHNPHVLLSVGMLAVLFLPMFYTHHGVYGVALMARKHSGRN